MTDTHNYNTRNSSIKNLVLPRMSTTHGQSSCFFTWVKLWNSISLNIRSVSYSRFMKFVNLCYPDLQRPKFRNHGREKGKLFLNIFSVTSVMSNYY